VDKAEFRKRIDRLKMPRDEIAAQLGLSVPGLNHQLYGLRAVSRQTELLLEHLEREQTSQKRRPVPRRDR
jgi:hypothetical protein